MVSLSDNGIDSIFSFSLRHWKLDFFFFFFFFENNNNNNNINRITLKSLKIDQNSPLMPHGSNVEIKEEFTYESTKKKSYSSL